MEWRGRYPTQVWTWVWGLAASRLDGLWEALEAVHDRDGDVLAAAVARVVETFGPDRHALIGLKPQA